MGTLYDAACNWLAIHPWRTCVGVAAWCLLIGQAWPS